MTRAALMAAAALLVAPAPAGAATARCTTTTVKVAAGGTATLRLDCRYRGKTVSGGSRRALVARPKAGRLASFDARRGIVRYRAPAGFSGRATLDYSVRLKSGRKLRGRIVIVVARSAPKPTVQAAAAPAATPTPTPTPDGLPAVLPSAPASVAFSTRNWQPTPQDTCPKALHDRYAVIGPDGKVYPTWHPPTVIDPATGKECTFGHEHGRDPHGSKIFDWVAQHFAAPGEEAYAGIPFGAATEALDEYANAHPGTAHRSEDHVGYKIDYANDVPLTTADGATGVSCDYLVRVHQGSHSPDALANNVHELLYAARCTDGTELISNIVARFGAAGQYARSCDGSTVTTIDNGYPRGAGSRAIPDRTCLQSTFLVPAGRTTSAWAAYELWRANSELTTADNHVLASYDTGFGVFNPSRYGDGAAARRTLDLCWETEPNGDRANGQGCDAAGPTPFAFDDVRSPFNGTQRDLYLRDTKLANAGGPRLWWTDPYGGNASPTPFPGGVCQLIGTSDTPARTVSEQVFGRGYSFDARGVHSPN